MIRFRKAHPSLSRSRFWRDDVRWYGPGPTVDMASDSRTLAFYLRGGTLDDSDLYVMINASSGDLPFQLHEGQPTDWQRVIDTAIASPDDIEADARGAPKLRASTYTVQGRSVVVLLRSTDV